MTFLFIVLGLIGGAILYGVWGDVGAIVIAGALGYVLRKLLRAGERLAGLELAVRNLEKRLEEGHAVSPAAVEEILITPDVSVTPEEAGPQPSADSIPGEAAQPQPPPAGVHAGPAAEVKSHAYDASGSSAPPLRHDGEPTLPHYIARFFTSGNLLVKVGVLVLFIGIAFLLKYAAEHQRLPIEVRLIGVSLGGMALLFTGWRLRRNRLNYGLVLEGGGVAVLYLTVFAALRLYELVPPALAFVILVALGALSAFLAVVQQSQSLAILSVAGGFMAPILTSTGSGSHVMLFSYYAILDAGILGIAWFRAWRSVNLVGFLFTFGIGMTWGYRFYQPAYFTTVEPFLILFFVFYVAVAVLYASRQSTDLKGYVDGTLVFGTPVVAFGLQVLLVKGYQYGIAWSALGLGLFYLGLAWTLFLKGHQSLRTMSEAFLAMGVAFGTIAIPLALDNRWSAAAWAMEGAAMVWIGVRQHRLLARAAGMFLQIGAGLIFMHKLQMPVRGLAILNGHYLGCLAVSLAGLFTSFQMARKKEEIEYWEHPLGIGLAVWGLLWWFGGGLAEIDYHAARSYRMAFVIAFFASSTLLSDYMARRLDWPLLHYPAFGLVPALFGVCLALSAMGAHPFSEAAYLAWPPAFAAAYWILWKHEDDRPGILRLFHASSLWLLTAVIAWELSWRTHGWVGGGGTWPLIPYGLVPSLMVVLIAKSSPSVPWPLGKHFNAYLTLGAGPVVPLIGLWALFLNFTNRGDPRPLSYLPILNPLDVTVGFVFLSLLLWFLRVRTVTAFSLSIKQTRLVFGVYAASIFAWLNGILIRTIHHWGGVRFTPHAMFKSLVFQESISIFWTVTALCIMIFATRRRMRFLWFLGGGLLAVVVVKLFVVDLSKTGTVERIVTFIVVGLLLLIVGYFSPVPPREESERVAGDG